MFYERCGTQLVLSNALHEIIDSTPPPHAFKQLLAYFSI